MTELPFYKQPVSLVSNLKKLHATRKANKVTSKRQILTISERKQILKKTDNRCHVCGVEITGTFQADHVKCHSSGGDHNVANYLPSCSLCNNYRWHYSPQEIQWILKLGVWARGEIANETITGNLMVKAFISHEQRREKRRRKPRQSH